MRDRFGYSFYDGFYYYGKGLVCCGQPGTPGRFA